jgi:hypothetical protein
MSAVEVTPGPWRIERWGGGNGNRSGYYLTRAIGDETECLTALGKPRRFTSPATAQAAITRMAGTGKPIGRPPGTGKGRTSTVTLTLTPAGKADMMRVAQVAGMSASMWVEQCVQRELLRIAKREQ